MKKRRLVTISILGLLLIMLAFGTTLLAEEAPAAGSGTPADPYQIETLDHLLWISANTALWNKHFIQTANIDAADTESWNDGAGWIPIGHSTTQFTGSYNGQGYVIDGLTINQPAADNIGLFGYVSGQAELKGVNINNADIKAGIRAGILAGRVDGDVQIINCSVNGVLEGSHFLGGLIGRITGGSPFITNSRTEVNVVSTSTDYADAGGFIGKMDAEQATITKSSAAGSVVSEARNIGGFVGFLDGGQISHSASTTNVSTQGNQGNVGGFVGAFGANSSITDSYARGSVTAADNTAWQGVGGFVGRFRSATDTLIRNSYATGAVNADGGSVGGFVGNDPNDPGAVIENSFWNTETTGRAECASEHTSGKDTAAMRVQSTYTAAGWDFAAHWTINSRFNGGYPKHLWQLTPIGDGTSPETAYQISSLEHLHWISLSPSRWNKHYRQTANIDASPTAGWGSNAWTPIGNQDTKFSGSYDGQGYAITGFSLTTWLNDFGLFGITNNAIFTNIHILDANIRGRQSGGILAAIIEGSTTVANSSTSGYLECHMFAGGLVGRNNGGIITSSHSSANVRGGVHAGGLVGRNAGTITFSSASGNLTVSTFNLGYTGASIGGLAGSNNEIIDNSFATGDVTSYLPKANDFVSTRIGGLVGANYGSVTNSYARGSVTGRGYVGGLAGQHSSGAVIRNSYSTGIVSGDSNVGGLAGNDHAYMTGTVSNSFWDRETSGMTSSAGGTSRTTAQMHTYENYANAGWDFLGENTNGVDDYWGINPSVNDGYPFLSFEGFTQIPIITTQDVTAVEGGTATAHGTIINYGSPSITEHGHVWSTAPGPTLGDQHTELDSTSTTGSFTTEITGLGPLTTYFVRAYAVSNGEIVYGEEIEFTKGKQWVTVGGTLSVKDKIYDGEVTVEVESIDLEIEGALPGYDDLSLENIVIGFSDPNAGEGKTVRILSADLAGENAGDYDLSLKNGPTTTADILPRELTVTADSHSKIYGETDPQLTYQIIDGELLPGEAISGALTRESGEDVGEYEIQQGTITAGTNYEIIYIPAELTITPRELTITADAKNKVYGEADPGLTYQITSGALQFDDELSGSLTRAEGEDVGVYEIKQGTLAIGANYNLTYESAELTITPRMLTITAEAKSKMYGEDDPVLTYQLSSVELQFADELVGSLTRAAGEDVGEYQILLGTLTAGSNYDVTYIPADLTVTPRALTVSADDRNKVYGEADPVLTYQVIDGELQGDDGLTGALTRSQGEDVGGYQIEQGSLTAGLNYDLTYIAAELTITPRALTVSADNVSKVYGEDDPVFTHQLTEGVLQFDDQLTGELIREAGEDAGEYEILQGSLAAGDNYLLTYNSAVLIITPRELMVTADNQGKVYNGQAFPEEFTVTYSGFADGEDESILNGELVFAGEALEATDAGSYAITVEGVNNTNYSISFADGTLVIEPAALTVSADAQDKVYGDSDPALTHQITSGTLVAGDTLTGFLTRVQGEDVGEYQILQGTLSAGSNYTLTYIAADLTISPYALTIAADAKSKVYGEDDPEFTYQITEGALQFDDTFAGALTREEGEDAGSYQIEQGSLTAGSNYDLTYIATDLTIIPYSLTIAADAKSKVYGEDDPVFTYQITEGALQFDDTFAGALTREEGEDAGNYQIEQGTLTAGENYDLTFLSAELTIAPKSLTIAAKNRSMVYNGETFPEEGYAVTYTGFVSGEDESHLDGDLVFTGSAVGAVDARVYIITPGGVSNTNYNITFVDGTLVIEQAELIITAQAKNKTYGDADPELAYQITSGELVEGDDLTGALARVEGEDIGVYEIQQGTLAAGANYQLVFETADFTINPRGLTITADNQSKVYNGQAFPPEEFTVTYSGFADGEDESILSGELVFAGEALDATDSGSYAITVEGVNHTNYSITFVDGTLVIEQAALTVSSFAQDKVYGESDPALTYQITAGTLFAGDTLTGFLTRVQGEDVGEYQILQGTLSAGSNYDLTYIAADLTITPYALTIAADAKSKVYGEGDPQLTYQITGGALQFDDTLTGALTREEGENAGNYLIEQGTLTAGANYDLTYIPADLTITPYALTIAADAKSKVYGEDDPAFTYQITGGALQFDDILSGSLTRKAGEDVGEYEIRQGTLTAGANYSLEFITAELTVTPVVLTITVDNQAKVYDGKTFTDFTVTYTGFVYDEDESNLSGELTFAGEAAEAINVGSYTITAQGVSSSNYDIIFVDGTLLIEQADLTITAKDQGKAYDGEIFAVDDYQVSFQGFVAGEDESILSGTLNFTGTAVTAVDVGTYTIVPAGLSSENYNITFKTGTLTIYQAELTITAKDQSKVYNGEVFPIDQQSIIIEGFFADEDVTLLGGELSFSGSAISAVDAGTYTIMPTGLTSDNYHITFVPGTLTITPAPLTISADNQSKTYDGKAFPSEDYTMTYEGFVAGEDAGGLSGELSFGSAQTAVNAGSYAIEPEGLSSNNYKITFVSGTLTITPAPLTISADNQSKTYDGKTFPAEDYTVTYQGFAAGEDETILHGELSFSGSAIAAVNTGAYTIVPAGVSSTNYDITFVPGTLTITKAELTVTVAADNQNKVYDGKVFPSENYTVTFAGFAGGDDEGVLSGELTFSGSAMDAIDAGTYTILPSGFTSKNYEITFVPGTLTITPALLTIAADNQSKTYDGKAFPSENYTVTYQGFVAGEDETILKGELAFSGSAITALTTGAYTIEPTGLSSKNYAITFVPGTLTIAPKILTISATAGDNGTISPSGKVNVAYGTDQSFTIKAAANHHLAELLVNGAPVKKAAGKAIYEYTFTTITENQTITATFAPNAPEKVQDEPADSVPAMPAEREDAAHEEPTIRITPSVPVVTAPPRSDAAPTNDKPASELIVRRVVGDSGETYDLVDIDRRFLEEAIPKAAQGLVGITIPKSGDEPADRLVVNIFADGISLLADIDTGLELVTDSVVLVLAKDEIRKLQGQDIEIMVGSLSAAEKDKAMQVINMHAANAEAVGIPLRISTDLAARTKVILPLADIGFPEDPVQRKQFIDLLAVFVEHSEGDNEVIKGEILYDDDENPEFIVVWVDKFSTFTVILTGELALPQEAAPGETDSQQEAVFNFSWLLAILIALVAVFLIRRSMIPKRTK
ncbi:MBG domain-containing protein [Dethiobacter alkaliphilus]|uniref:MBG domain-containing protein n=1 Tax=Dethiobacter alkaliphilus TaxID=427926 RepID=UPI002227F873|nr:MBG domain-containing protein [Dethiobacter alkaliphilus]MCW3491516.1 YDG domain-containing protein [Dethiobacter alkaliphilus]